ncbi:MAG: Brp/Blh family beta-carotene 15,15'-dioxygenase [Porticoccaceae bacterium]|jgi:beta-carotene 15,15'-dioxygenase|nr:Brp/Blh family beta-carotene 15,15'-dioxygenase [Porticoccaceae bacterium]MDG1312414.1 Brp/Blh family beta-carotene 15,15'-dioxygenase [Porticoccaceae bacterium]
MNSLDMLAIAAVLLLGVPHGGLDGAVARRIGWPTGLMSWFGFHLAYVSLAVLVALLWWLFPLPSLSLFLLISALHFGASDIADIGSDWLPWVAHGGLICIGIPSLQPALVEPIFAILVGAENASLLMAGIANLFLPWVVSILGYCGYACLKIQYRKSSISLLILAGLVSVLPPLISFALYFCLWHSRGHMLRLWRSLEQSERQRTFREAMFYTAASWIAAGFIFYYLQGSTATSLVQLTFIGLAALTLPHMLLVDYADKKNKKEEALP